MDYREFAPLPSLQPLVRCYWTLNADGAQSDRDPEPALPDGSPELIFNFGDPFHAIHADGSASQQPLLMLVGQITGPFTVAPTGRMDLIAVRFRPHGATLVCDDLGAITDTWADGATLPTQGLTALYDRLRSTPNVNARVTLLDAWLSECVRLRPTLDPSVAAAVAAIEDSHGTVSLDALATTLGCSLRQLQRRFAVQVGIAPKLLARIRRFQRVFCTSREEPSSLACVAAECGYFDQSHLIRDFRDFAGQAPAAFLANQPEFTQLFLPTKPPEV